MRVSKLLSNAAVLHQATSFVLPAPLQDCSSFADTLSITGDLINTTIVSSEVVSRNGMIVLDSTATTNLTNSYEFCQVICKQDYGGNNTLGFQLWMPMSKIYEGRFMAVGGGGMAGAIDTSSMMLHLNEGFAVAGGDSGHLAADNNDGSGAPGVYLPYLHNTDEINAWIHNAISLFTIPSKSIVTFFYGAAAKYAYYDGCSTGGAQGFALAELYPDLYDGIIAGSPGNWYSHLALSFLWNSRHTQDNASYVPQATLSAITAAVMDACDANDGVLDRLIENPLKCAFEISSMACSSSSTNASTCLTPAQLAAVTAIYSGPRTSNGSQIYPGFDLGSEIEWLLQEGTLSAAFSIPLLQNLVYNNLSYDASTFNFDTQVADMDAKAGVFIDETSTNLTAFRSHGGKLLVTQGWADPYNAATWPIQHLQDVTNFFGEDISDFYNLFMVPGGGHCGAASLYPSVPATYHTVDQIVKWVEKGEKPDGVVSTDAPDGSSRSRLLCPWPQNAVYMGGDEGLWSSYICEE